MLYYSSIKKQKQSQLADYYNRLRKYHHTCQLIRIHLDISNYVIYQLYTSQSPMMPHHESEPQQSPDQHQCFEEKILFNMFTPSNNKCQSEVKVSELNHILNHSESNQELINVFDSFQQKQKSIQQDLEDILSANDKRKISENKDILQGIMESEQIQSEELQFQFMQSSCNKYKPVGQDFVSICSLQQEYSLLSQHIELSKEEVRPSQSRNIQEQKTVEDMMDKQLQKKLVKKARIKRKEAVDSESSASEYNPEMKRRKKNKLRVKNMKNIQGKSHFCSGPKPKTKGGCTCKKTKCQKKYCECFSLGSKCGDSCHCLQCHNK